MQVPVSGFMYEPQPFANYWAPYRSNSNWHSHQVFITESNGQPTHVHEFLGTTSFNEGHEHQYVGTTEPAPNGIQHTHEYLTVTHFEDRHRHELSGRTGPAIPVQGGGHVHYFEGYTNVYGVPPHRHVYRGYTRPSSH